MDFKAIFKRYRTTITLGAICAVVFGFIWLYERQTLSTGEVAERQGRLLERFVRARCEKIEVQRHGQTLTLVRQRADDEESELGVWKITTPVTAEADDDAVSALLGALEWMDDRREFRDVNAADRTRMGLDRPRLRAWLTVANERTIVTFGGEDARSEGVYAQLADRGVVFVVGKDVFEALDHDASHFRDKALFHGETSPRLADRVTLRVAGGPLADAGEVQLSRDGARWSLNAPLVGFASRDGVDDVLTALDDLRATRFIAERAGDLARYGLDAPAIELVAEAPPPMGQDGGTRPGFRLRIGRACADHADEVYALADALGPVVCVTEMSTRGLARAAEDLREKRVLIAEDGVIESLTLTTRATAGVGEARLALEHDGDDWRRVDGGDGGGAVLADAARADGGRTDGGRADAGRPRGTSADADAVAQWLSALRALTPSAFERITDANGGDDAALLARHGLAQPRATLTVDRGEELGTEVVALGNVDMDGVWLRRGEEPVALRVAVSAQEQFVASAFRVRPLRVIEEDDATATSLRIDEPAREFPVEEVARDGQVWRVKLPVELPAERARVVGLLRAFATLRADRWVADRAVASHGLAQPKHVVTVQFGDANAAAIGVRTLRIGSDTIGGAYAQVDAGAVFVVPEAFLADLRAPLAAQDLLLTPVDDIVALTVVRGTTRRSLRREGTAWRDGARTLEAAEVDSFVRPLLDGLASLRVEPTAYTATLIATPRARITIERSAGEPRSMTILVGAESTGDGPRTAAIARDGLNLVFRGDTALIAPLLGEAPPPAPAAVDEIGPAL